jgi:hypothetical protein
MKKNHQDIGAREWGEFTRMLGGLTSVSAQISGANAPSQGMWRVPPTSNQSDERDAQAKARSGLTADLGRFGETTLPFFSMGADALPS